MPTIALLRTRIVLILLLAAVVSGCGDASSAGHRTVVASFYPLAYAAEQVAPPGTRVQNLTPPGAEPHDLEVAPSDVETIGAAKLVLLMGHGFQPQLEDAAGSGDRVVHALDTPGLQRLPNGDPHVWLDPTRYALIVRRIGAALHRPGAAAQLVGRLARARPRVPARAQTLRPARPGDQPRGVRLPRAALRAQPDRRHRPRAGGGADAARARGRRRPGARVGRDDRLPRAARLAADRRHGGARDRHADRGARPARGADPDTGDYFTVMRANLAALRKALGCR